MFFVAAASAAAIDDADKKQDKRGVLGLGYGGYAGYGGYGAPIAAPIAAAPLAAYHAPLGLHAPAIGKLKIYPMILTDSLDVGECWPTNFIFFNVNI